MGLGLEGSTYLRRGESLHRYHAETLIAASAGGMDEMHLAEDTKLNIAVLPLVNTSNDPNTEYLSDGISGSLINKQ